MSETTLTPYGKAIKRLWPEYYLWLVKHEIQEAQGLNQAPTERIGTPGGTRKGSRRQDGLISQPGPSEARD